MDAGFSHELVQLGVLGLKEWGFRGHLTGRSAQGRALQSPRVPVCPVPEQLRLDGAVERGRAWPGSGLNWVPVLAVLLPVLDEVLNLFRRMELVWEVACSLSKAGESFLQEEPRNHQHREQTDVVTRTPGPRGSAKARRAV